MENLVMPQSKLPEPSFWAGKNVFLTGHTGFKGGWLALYLTELGARVHGYALPPAPGATVFNACRLDALLASHTLSDIRDYPALLSAMQKAKPDVVLHLAAQPLVRQSYLEPVETFSVNAMGTVHLMESLRHTPGVRAALNITTDKCYANQEWPWPYREADTLGGSDPYSGSKACSELITQTYRQAFLDAQGVWVASVRAGNVIGGGDVCSDRLVPDFFRAMEAGVPLRVRSPEAVRPWQHVFDPLSGYLLLAERLWADGRQFAEAWNFGPASFSVRDILDRLCAKMPQASWTAEPDNRYHETTALRLDSSKAMARLNWQPLWDLNASLAQVVAWQQACLAGGNMRDVSLEHLRGYLRAQGSPVAVPGTGATG